MTRRRIWTKHCQLLMPPSALSALNKNIYGDKVICKPPPLVQTWECVS